MTTNAAPEVLSGGQEQGAPAVAAEKDASKLRAGWDWRRDARTAAIALVTSCLAVGGLMAYQANSERHTFGLVDVAEVVEIEQMRVTSLVLKPGVTASEKEDYFKQANAFGQKLEEAIAQVKRDCKCELLARSAYVGSGAVDLTEAIKARVGLGGLQLEQMRSVGKAAFMSRLPEVRRPDAPILGNGTRP